MRRILDLSLIVVLALVLGIGSALFVLDRQTGGGPMVMGPWSADAGQGAALRADPYAVAAAAARIDLALGVAEGIAFIATTDDDGAPLRGSCDYTIRGGALPGRLWTLTVYGADGSLIASPSGRSGFHSRELLRQPGGAFSIGLSAAIEPGNWLSSHGAEGLRLVLRLYDTPLTTTGAMPQGLTLPTLTRERCR